MGQYRFVTTWTFSAPVERVWHEVGDPLNWKTYWVGLQDVAQASPETVPGAGAVYDLTFKSLLPYTLALTARIEDYVERRRMVMVTTGELEGRAEFVVDEVAGGTRTQLVWTTCTTKPWMNALAFAFGGLFAWNHDVLMRRAGRGLAERIGSEVIHEQGTAPSLARALMPFALIAICIAAVVRRLRGWQAAKEEASVMVGR